MTDPYDYYREAARLRMLRAHGSAIAIEAAEARVRGIVAVLGYTPPPLSRAPEESEQYPLIEEDDDYSDMKPEMSLYDYLHEETK
jgi:hypothetical protein